MKSHAARVLGILWIVALSIPAAWASETEDSSSEEWSFTVTPYVWAISIKGSAAPLPPFPATDFEASFGDIWKDLNLGFFGKFASRRIQVTFLASYSSKNVIVFFPTHVSAFIK